MFEKYYKYKSDYRNYVLFIKCGSFYEVIDSDAFIINKLFNYKLKRLGNNFKAGFPATGLNKVLFVLNENKINYVVIDEEIVLEKKFRNNKYLNYKCENNSVFYNSLRIEKIYNYLNDNILSISDKLDKIEDVIYN